MRKKMLTICFSILFILTTAEVSVGYDKEALQALRENPWALSIRENIDNYKANNLENVNELFAEEMDNIDIKDVSGKFYFLDAKKSIMGGMNVLILFPSEKPAVYNVWVYRISDGAYVPRSIRKVDTDTAKVADFLDRVEEDPELSKLTF